MGRGDAAGRVAGVLSEAGHPVAIGASITRVGGRRPAAAVLVSSYVADPLEHQRWLRRDIAHLPIVFGEVAVTIGPLVVPGVTACLACIERQRAADDGAWSAVAAQLWGRTAPTGTVALATEASIEALRLLHGDHSTDSAAADADLRATTVREASIRDGLAVRLDVDTGERTERVWVPNEQCGCGGLSSWPAPALHRESGSEPARLAPRSAAGPTRARALAAHA